MFDHWEQMTYDPLKEDSPANVIMLDVRKRKGLKPQPNVISEYEVRGASRTVLLDPQPADIES